jgi:hypothetical protein
VHLGKRVTYLEHDAGPQVGVHPDMRIVAVFVIVMGNQQVARQFICDGDHRAGLAEFEQEVFHLCLEVEPMPQDEIRAGGRDDIAAGLAIGMRVDARAHQCRYLHEVAAHFPRGIGDHAGRRDDFQALLRHRGSRASAMTAAVRIARMR